MPRKRARSELGVRASAAVALGALSGCVPGVPHFVTASEARAGHPYEDAEYGSAELVLQPPLPTPPVAEAGATNSVATAGYWHWNGLAYELVPGGHETSDPPYLWRWQDDQAR